MNIHILTLTTDAKVREKILGYPLKNEVKGISNAKHAVFSSAWPSSALSTSVLLQVAGFLSSHISPHVVFFFSYRQECVSWQNKAR